MVPIEQKDWTEGDIASKLGQNHPLESTKRQNNKAKKKGRAPEALAPLSL